MSEKISQAIYYLWYLLKSPFRNLYKWANRLLTKPKNLLRFSAFMTLLALFEDNVGNFIIGLRPQLDSIIFISLFSITAIIYIWKESDPRFGETWKSGWKRWREGKNKLVSVKVAKDEERLKERYNEKNKEDQRKGHQVQQEVEEGSNKESGNDKIHAQGHEDKVEEVGTGV